MTILAAIDDSAVAGPVLDVARRIATLFGTSVETIHVGAGDVVSTLQAEAEKCDAVALVIGRADRPGKAALAGPITLDLVQSLDRPVVVVPPAADRPLRRVLVAVEGDGQSHALTGAVHAPRRSSDPGVDRSACHRTVGRCRPSQTARSSRPKPSTASS